MFAPMAYGSLYYDLERPYNVIEASFFASLRRVSWAMGLSIFIISHRFGDIRKFQISRILKIVLNVI